MWQYRVQCQQSHHQEGTWGRQHRWGEVHHRLYGAQQQPLTRGGCEGIQRKEVAARCARAVSQVSQACGWGGNVSEKEKLARGKCGARNDVWFQIAKPFVNGQLTALCLGVVWLWHMYQGVKHYKIQNTWGHHHVQKCHWAEALCYKLSGC